MVERQLPKLHTRVRFPSPAPDSGFDAQITIVAPGNYELPRRFSHLIKLPIAGNFS